MLFLLQLRRGSLCYSNNCLVFSNQFFSSYFTAAMGIRFLQSLVLYAEPFMETINREFSKSFFIKPISHIFYTFDCTCTTFWPSISNWCHGRNFLYFIDQIIFWIFKWHQNLFKWPFSCWNVQGHVVPFNNVFELQLFSLKMC